jgi:outer membrane autotransporter protein
MGEVMWKKTLIGRAAPGRLVKNTQQATRPVPLRGSVLPAAIVAIAAAAMADNAGAQTFSQAFTDEARRLCADGALPGAAFVGPPTNIVEPSCNFFFPVVFGTAAGIGGFSAPSAALAIQERLRTARESEGGGASSDEVVSLGQGLSVFASAGAEALSHSNNRYEDGYESTIPSLTVGGDYEVTPWLVAGLAFNYFNFSGDYDDGGDFNTNSFGPIAYASFLPFGGAFADVTLGYARKDFFRNRDGVIICDCGNLEGHQSGGTDGNQYSAGLLLGYDYPIENFTVGPRIGLNYIFTHIDDYKEHGNNGLALDYSGQDESSLQSSLGIFATMAISTQFGVLLPQLSASWVHDYAVGGRTINAGFVDATEPSKFSFKREPVAPNFANISAGVSTLLPNRWQPFITFRTIQGNENLVSYGGTAGLRVGL